MLLVSSEKKSDRRTIVAISAMEAPATTSCPKCVLT
jgi:ribosomal protein L32